MKAHHLPLPVSRFRTRRPREIYTGREFTRFVSFAFFVGLVGGFFLGGIIFGEALLRLHRTQSSITEKIQNENRNR